MKNIKHSQSGFSAVEAVAIIAVIAVIGTVGFLVYNNNKKANVKPVASTQTSRRNATQDENTVSQTPILYQGVDGTAYDIAVLAENNDQKGAAAAISAQCMKTSVAFDASTSTHNVVGTTGTADLFNGKDKNHDYTQTGNSMFINASCYDKNVGGSQSGGGQRYVLAKQNGKWTVLESGQGQ